MAWQVPCNLQWWCANTIAHTIVRKIELKIRNHHAAIRIEPVIARAATTLILQESDYEDSDDGSDEVGVPCSQEESDECEDAVPMDPMDLVIMKIKSELGDLKEWWNKIPESVPKHLLEVAFEYHTEVHPDNDEDFPKHLSSLLLRLVLFKDVFIDRDYSDKDRRCVIPFIWEIWTAKLVSQLSPFPQLVNLKVYGGLYPSIFEVVLKGSLNLSSLYISHINITDEILLVIAESCPNIQTLYLVHNFPWQVISMKAFCAAFFSNASRAQLTRAFKIGLPQDIRPSFPKLEHIELAYGDIEAAREFHRLLLNFYPNLKSLCCPWKTTYFEDGYESHAQSVLLPLVARQRPVSIRNVFFDDLTLYNLGHRFPQHLKLNCPNVETITLNCTLLGSRFMIDIAGKQLVKLKESWDHLTKLHIKIHTEDYLTRTLMLPLLEIHGSCLKAFSMEATSMEQTLHVSTLCTFLTLCPNLTHLSVRVWSKSMVKIQLEKGRVVIPKCSTLQEFTFHEEGPQDVDDEEEEARQLDQWMALLTGVLTAAPKVSTLSLSVCSGLSSILDKLVCDVQVLHLHVKDGCEWQPTTEQLCQLVSRLPNLQHLHLEEVSAEVYWKIRRRYQHSDLRLHWGNLYDWPRT